MRRRVEGLTAAPFEVLRLDRLETITMPRITPDMSSAELTTAKTTTQAIDDDVLPED